MKARIRTMALVAMTAVGLDAMLGWTDFSSNGSFSQSSDIQWVTLVRSLKISAGNPSLPRAINGDEAEAAYLDVFWWMLPLDPKFLMEEKIPTKEPNRNQYNLCLWEFSTFCTPGRQYFLANRAFTTKYVTGLTAGFSWLLLAVVGREQLCWGLGSTMPNQKQDRKYGKLLSASCTMSLWSQTGAVETEKTLVDKT